MGRKSVTELLIFLGMGLTRACFHKEGTSQVVRDLLKIIVRGDSKESLHLERTILGMLSGVTLTLGERLRKAHKMSTGVTKGMSNMEEGVGTGGRGECCG